ncbi:hypothetical protein [Roseobacter weihaiensis]|uniref:hypothetical protein n=1 Tax=Roseobacter weihaiensis TaxID=2763262 RepID=UPI001D0A431E|nr:hypothetical protein [Roseobacter sp. H9]
MVVTMIPGIDQLVDAQDMVTILYRLIWKREYDVSWTWILRIITLIGLVPVLGSLAKGILKLVFKKIGDLADIYGIFNFLTKGTAHIWRHRFAINLPGKQLTDALAVLGGMMAGVVQRMTLSSQG